MLSGQGIYVLGPLHFSDDPAQLMETYRREALRDMCREAGIWRSENKRALAAGLLCGVIVVASTVRSFIRNCRPLRRADHTSSLCVFRFVPAFDNLP